MRIAPRSTAFILGKYSTMELQTWPLLCILKTWNSLFLKFHSAFYISDPATSHSHKSESVPLGNCSTVVQVVDIDRVSLTSSDSAHYPNKLEQVLKVIITHDQFLK